MMRPLAHFALVRKMMTGGLLLLRVQDATPLADLDTIRDNDPFFKAGLASYEPLLWNPGIGRDALDRL